MNLGTPELKQLRVAMRDVLGSTMRMEMWTTISQSKLFYFTLYDSS